MIRCHGAKLVLQWGNSDCLWKLYTQNIDIPISLKDIDGLF